MFLGPPVYLIVVLVLFPSDSQQKGRGVLMTAPIADNEGTEFVFAFGSNYENSGGVLEVFVTTRVNAIVDFNYTEGNTVKASKITAGQTFSYTIPDSYRMTANKTSIEEKAQFIYASDDIVVYASNKQNLSTDAFMVYPTDVLENQYLIPAWPGNFRQGGSMIVVAATEDNTAISVYLNGTELTFPHTSINRGQVYQYISDVDKPNTIAQLLRATGGIVPNSSASEVYDLTGAVVSSNKPIAVFSGNVRADVHTRGNRPFTSDHLVEMIPPISTLGREFLTSSAYERKGDIFRIIGAHNSTDIVIYRSSTNTNETRTLGFVGDFVTILTKKDEVMHISTSGPAIVAQYTQSDIVDRAGSDPMMTLVTPKEQYGNYYTFTTPTDIKNSSYRNYVNIIIKTTHIDGIILDGESVTKTFNSLSLSAGDNITANCWTQDDWIPIGSSGYSARTLAVEHGTHSIFHTNPTVAFNAIMYGQIKHESYGFPAGARLSPIGDFCIPTNSTASDGLDNDCDDQIDEELLNGIDDDGDGLIDEDFVLVPTTTSTTTISKTTLPSSTEQSQSTALNSKVGERKANADQAQLEKHDDAERNLVLSIVLPIVGVLTLATGLAGFVIRAVYLKKKQQVSESPGEEIEVDEVNKPTGADATSWEHRTALG